MIVWLGAVIGAFFGIYHARKRKGRALDMAQYGGVYAIAFAIVALVINVVILRTMGG